MIDETGAYWLLKKLSGDHWLHHALASASNSRQFPVFRESAADLIATLLARQTPFDSSRLQRLRSDVSSIAVLPHQLVHRDPHRLNILFSDDGIPSYLDFDLVHKGPRLFDLCYCASGVLSESFRTEGYRVYRLKIVERIFRAYRKTAALSPQEILLAWSMLITIQLIFMNYCLEWQILEGALLNQEMRFWYDDHRGERQAAVAIVG